MRKASEHYGKGKCRQHSCVPLDNASVVFAFKITTNYHAIIWNVYEKNCLAERKGVITTEQAAAGQEAWLFVVVYCWPNNNR